MKKILLLPALLFMVFHSLGQAKTNVGLSKDAFLLKSKNQKKVARILLVGGAGLLATGVIIPKGEVTGRRLSDPWNPFSEWENEYKDENLKYALGLAGFASMVGSIPFFNASSKNKRRAASACYLFSNATGTGTANKRIWHVILSCCDYQN